MISHHKFLNEEKFTSGILFLPLSLIQWKKMCTEYVFRIDIFELI